MMETIFGNRSADVMCTDTHDAKCWKELSRNTYLRSQGEQIGEACGLGDKV